MANLTLETISNYFEPMLEKESERIEQERINEKTSIELFQKAIIMAGNVVIRSRGLNHLFVIDENNQLVIEQLYYYYTRDHRFTGSLDKGFVLVGPYGSGKTILMQAFAQIVKRFTPFKIWFLPAISLHNKVIERGRVTETIVNSYGLISSDNYHESCNLFKSWILFDDLGKEPKEGQSFGNSITPMADILSARYEQGSLTFATSNAKLETLGSYYGDAVADRMIEMFNEIVLTGPSRRK